MAKKEESELISIPFTPKEIKKLTIHQEDPNAQRYTCANSNSTIPECERRGEGQGLLALKDGIWVCPCGKYKQYWAYRKDTK